MRLVAVGFVVHEHRPEAAEMARKATRWLVDRHHQVRLPKSDAENVGLPEHGCSPEELPEGLTVVVALGGDGTMLRAVHLVSRAGVPLLGVNLGRLGYLASLEPGGLVEGLERVLAGDYSIEERMMLSVLVQRSGEPVAPDPLAGDLWALNEAVVERPAAGHTVHMAVQVNGRFWTTYSSDGLIVATPTGSTAYAYSAGGPIVSPSVRALLITPVSAHISFARSLVVDARDSVRIEVTDRPAALVLDGREMATLEKGDAILCTEAPGAARFVSLDGRDFFGILKTKFGVADR
ncbi:MAG TPA: NAD(+)/NADH kinase [Acidimicrobiales bacterium]|nr:NAD(+)/NADH kinase [Acidimicrobiales bacterium]